MLRCNTSTVRGTVADNIDSKIGKFLYQAGVSAADSAVMLGASAVTGLPALATVSMGMSAAADQAKGIIERGGTNRQAFWGGLAAGIAEAVCEKMPLDNLLNATSADDVKGLLTNVFKHQLIEGGEEMVTEIANIISDAVIMKDNSKFNNRVEIYMAEGMSENEAKQKATMDAISDVALAGAGGFVAGGVLGGAVNVGKYASSGAMQGAGRGINVPVMGKYTANNQGAAGAVTSGNSNTQVQQSGNGQTQTVGNTSVFDGKTGGRTHTQVAGNSNAPTAARSSGAMQTGTTANAQTPTGAQHQMQAQTDTQNGKTIKAEGKVSELLQEAMAQPADSPARQLAEQLLAQQETALVEQGLELGSQYQLSHADQAQLAAETANNAVSDQTIGELSRLMEQNTPATTDLGSFFNAAVDVIKSISGTSLEKHENFSMMEIDAILSGADPMLELMGMGIESNPEQVHLIVQELESNGVEILHRNGSMAYSPGLIPGKPGQFFIDKNASYSAWLHEYKHFCDDKEDGFLGMRVFMDTKKCIQREIDAYNIEIELAKRAGRHDIVKRLEELKENEISRYE